MLHTQKKPSMLLIQNPEVDVHNYSCKKKKGSFVQNICHQIYWMKYNKYKSDVQLCIC